MRTRTEEFIPKFTPEMLHGMGCVHGIAPDVIEKILCRYDLKEEKVEIGSHTLRMISLASLDQTIDQVFDFLQAEKLEHLLNALSPYFGQVWPSGLALAKWISGRLPRGARFLELGCGLALPSWVAALEGLQGLATDSHPHVGSFFARNLALNFGCSDRVSVEYRPLVWGELGDQKYEVILASDVLYESTHPDDLTRAVMEHLEASPTSTFYLADPGRPYLQKAIDCLQAAGLAYRMEAMTCLEKEIFLFEFRRV